MVFSPLVLRSAQAFYTTSCKLKSLPAMKKAKIIPINDDAVSVAADLLGLGKVIALPTDTVYGLACDANSPRAIQRLYRIKNRNEYKPVAICVAKIEDLRHWGQADHLPDMLLRKLLPGAVTIVLKKSKNLSNPHLNPGASCIGIRITENEFIQSVCQNYDQPIALTSANRSSMQSTLNIQEFKNLWLKLGAVFDGGQLSQSEDQRAASTVIDLSEEGYYSIIRTGVAVSSTISTIEEFGLKIKP